MNSSTRVAELTTVLQRIGVRYLRRHDVPTNVPVRELRAEGAP
jgi:hypothetical protein